MYHNPSVRFSRHPSIDPVILSTPSNTNYFASGFATRYATASATDVILSASVSGISTANSSSMAITTSTVSRESKPRSAAENGSRANLTGIHLVEVLHHRDDAVGDFGFIKETGAVQAPCRGERERGDRELFWERGTEMVEKEEVRFGKKNKSRRRWFVFTPLLGGESIDHQVSAAMSLCCSRGYQKPHASETARVRCAQPHDYLSRGGTVTPCRAVAQGWAPIANLPAPKKPTRC